MADREEIARLAGLGPIAYSSERVAVAEQMGVAPKVLDAEIKLFKVMAEVAIKAEKAAVRALAKAERDALKTRTKSQHINGHGFDRTTELVPLAGAEPEERSPAFSDDALALEFAQRHRNDLRYTALFGRWSRWTGQYWQSDETMEVFTMARKVCRDGAHEAEHADKDKEARMIASARTVAAVVSLARSDRRHAAVKEQWDADPWMLNTQTGILDLRNCVQRPHDPNAYCTAITSCGTADNCDLWLEFLNRSMGGNQELIAFLQRVAGYCLTGLTTEHAIFFLYGSGANGKSVFVSTLAGILADYHKSAPVEIFMESKTDRHPTELAMLNGPRLVTVTETEEGRKWAEAKLKALTGGDKISAHFMRQDFFEYTPKFKLMIAGNHKPSLRTVDEAIRRRMNLIPFSVTIPKEERDLDLTKKLRAEWPGILSWMLAGCAEWQRIGLRPPDAVKIATEAYLANEDSFSIWIEESCRREPTAFETGAALFSSWSDWCKKVGEYPGRRKEFNEKLIAAGCHEDRRKAARGFSGLDVISYASGEFDER